MVVLGLEVVGVLLLVAVVEVVDSVGVGLDVVVDSVEVDFVVVVVVDSEVVGLDVVVVADVVVVGLDVVIVADVVEVT